MEYTKNDRENYNRDREVVCDRLKLTINQYNYIRRLNYELIRIFTDNCNGIIENDDQYYSLVNPIIEKLNNYLYHNKNMDMSITRYFHLQTDPRGNCIYISDTPINESNYNKFGSHTIY
jgi:hypothetical protein